MIGETHGHYHITARLGAGGMGEVYRATDTKLKRDVAIKVLPDGRAQDPDRLARFQREAELLASLNHPHIAAIHGLEEADGKPLLILELVEGEDLATRLKRGPLPVGEALGIATQITDALQAAHEKGIVHRDLKPANVKITPEGQVKVLDFGLAKAWSGDPGTGGSSVDASQSPTLAHSGTAAGVILGTAAYMSPEQAMGKAVDKRADVWALGVVLFEMLTGERVFAGENASEILASVIKNEPAWERLPAATPTSVTRLLRRCLRKKPRERLQDIGDARLEVEEGREELVADPADSAPPSARGRATVRERLAWGLAAVAVVATSGMAARWLLSGPSIRGPLQLSVPLAPAQLDQHFAISPDGSRIVFTGRDENIRSLYVRALGQPAARMLPGTEHAYAPFFSPDGQWIAFFAGNPESAIKKVAATGGPVATVTGGDFRDAQGTWTEDGWIVVALKSAVSRPGELQRVRADGGSLEPLKVSDDDALQYVDAVSRVWGSRALLLAVGRDENSADASVAIQSLESGERRVLAPGGVSPQHLASGHVVYTHAGRLMAGRLDAEGMELVGTPVPLESVTGPGYVGRFVVSPGGVLVFTSGRAEEQRDRLVWTDRVGGLTPLPFDVVGYDPRLSPDGTHVSIDATVTDDRGGGDVWVWDLERGTRTRISSAPGTDETGTWSPDGRWIAWVGTRVGQTTTLYRRLSDGSGPEERLWSDERHFHVASWSPAGIVVTVSDPTTGWDVLVVDPDEPSEARPLLNATVNESSARISPDGRLLSFVSDETGRDEVYVQAFPESRGKVQVSVDGGVQPVWRPGAREIVYRGSGKIMSVTLGPGDPPSVSAPDALFDDRFTQPDDADHTAYAVHRDGRLLGFEAAERAHHRDLRIVLGWMEAAGLQP